MSQGRIIKLLICAVALIFVDGLFHCPVLRAMPRFMEWYDANPNAKDDLKGKCTVCHVSNDGSGPLSEFGQAFADQGYRFTPELAQAYPGMFAGGPSGESPQVAQGFDVNGFFSANCVVCHGKDGKGALGNAPDFTSTAWQNATSDAKLVETIKNGKGLMPAWKDQLNNDQVSAMVKFVRRFAK